MSETKCRAKNPSRCWKHGTQQGIVANEIIIDVINTPPVRYFITKEERLETSLKNLNSTGLTLTIIDESEASENIDAETIKSAILLASDVHQEDTRSNRGRYERTPYIEHPLRNTLRGIRFGADSQVIAVGNLLHDTVEDHPFEISEKYFGEKAETEEEARENCFQYIENTYGKDVSDMVRGMSNPILDKYTPVNVKNKAYADHVKEAIWANENVCIGKACDFIDNAVGLFHNADGKSMSKVGIRKRAAKYLPVCDILEERLKADLVERKLPVSTEGLHRMIKQIQDGRKSLLRLYIENS